MKRNRFFLLTLLALITGVLPMAADPIQLASWTFSTGYTVEENVYTPNTEAYAEGDNKWFKDGQPTIAANEAVGNAADYVVTGKTARYWRLCNGWENQVFRIVNDTEANDISDYTDASQHNNYYELRFPTTGYKDITVDFACA